MLRSLFSFLRFFVFWLLFFMLTRATFELYFYSKLKGASFWEITETYLYGLRMDASAAAYIATIPLLVFVVGWFFPKSHIKSIWLKIYTWICLFFISLITIVDLGIFTEWGAKVNFRAFDTLYDSPAESMSSTASSPIVLNLCIGFGLLLSGIILSYLIIDYSFKKPVEHIFQRFGTGRNYRNVPEIFDIGRPFFKIKIFGHKPKPDEIFVCSKHQFFNSC